MGHEEGEKISRVYGALFVVMCIGAVGAAITYFRTHRQAMAFSALGGFDSAHNLYSVTSEMMDRYSVCV